MGSTFADYVEFMGGTIEGYYYQILAYERNKSITMETSAGPVPLVAKYSFDEDEGVTKLAILADAEPGRFFKLATPIIRRQPDKQWKRNSANLKQMLES